MKKNLKKIIVLLLVVLIGQPLGLSASQIGSELLEISETKATENIDQSATSTSLTSDSEVVSEEKISTINNTSGSEEVNSSDENSKTLQKANSEKPTISGVKDITVNYGSNFDAKSGVTARAENGRDITANIKITGDKVDTKNGGGQYELIYTVTDPTNSKLVKSEKRTITVSKIKAYAYSSEVYTCDYYNGTHREKRIFYYGKKCDNKRIKTQIIYHSNGKIKSQTKYNESQKYISIETWASNEIRTNTKNYDGNGFKTKEYRYHPNGKIKSRYTYYKTGTSKYTRNDYSTEGKIISASRYYRSNNKIQFRKEYYANGKIKKATYYNTRRRCTNIETWNDSGVRTNRKKYDGNGFKTAEYRYHSNGKVKARYTYYKSGEAKYTRIDYSQTGIKTTFTKYDRKKNVLLKNKYFTNGKVSKSYKEHIAKNGVKTGITEKWYYSNGKLKKVDARTFPTYYSQYTPYYKTSHVQPTMGMFTNMDVL